MLDDFGVNELTWTKSKAEEDLESLNKAYKTLDEFNTGGKSTSVALKMNIINKDMIIPIQPAF